MERTAAPPQPLLFTQREACDYVGLSRWTFVRFVETGAIPQVLLPGARPRYRRSDIDQLIERSLVLEPAP